MVPVSKKLFKLTKHFFLFLLVMQFQNYQLNKISINSN